MGLKTTLIGGGLAVVAVGTLILLAIRFIPEFIDSLPEFKFPEFPEIKFPELPSLDDFLPDIPNPFAPNIHQNLPDIPFTNSELQAFQFKELIGRPQILGGAVINGVLTQTAGRQPEPGTKFFGSDFTSVERLADLFRRFKLTGRDIPGGRTIRINELIAARNAREQAKVLQGLETFLPASPRPARAGPASTHPSTKRGPNTIGVFGAKGVFSRKANIFSGRLNDARTPQVVSTRILTGFSSRASQKTKSFFQSANIAIASPAQQTSTRGSRRFNR